MKKVVEYPAVRQRFSNPINDALASYGCGPLTPDQFGAPGDPGRRIIGLTGHAKRGAGLADLTLTVSDTAIRDGRTVESRDVVTVRVGRPAVIIVPLLFIGQDNDDPSWHVVFARRHRLGQPVLTWTLPRGRGAADDATQEEPPDLLAGRVISETLGKHYLGSVGGCQTIDLGTANIGGELNPIRVLAFRSLAQKNFDRAKLDGEVLLSSWRSVRLMISKNWLTESDVVAALFKCECAGHP